jgi:hypothetical protein
VRRRFFAPRRSAFSGARNDATLAHYAGLAATAIVAAIVLEVLVVIAIGRDLNWVVVAQRFAVWIRLDSPPTFAMHVEMTASVKVRHNGPH